MLVVEDNLINQKILVAFLRKRGYQVDVASDGAEAVQRLAEKRYSLVLMDLQMPILDGFEATRLIRSLPQISDVPIVAVSAHALNGEPRRCLEAGMNGYLAKPVEPAELYAWVERFAGAPPAC
ncbi:MAG: response regulator [Bryobacteraceae bacterium]|nr:response regulator [Bryobacteraceae bacterium]MCX7603446.1 response regulator [Bryobacteraceae bacterium]